MRDFKAVVWSMKYYIKLKVLANNFITSFLLLFYSYFITELHTSRYVFYCLKSKSEKRKATPSMVFMSPN